MDMIIKILKSEKKQKDIYKRGKKHVKTKYLNLLYYKLSVYDNPKIKNSFFILKYLKFLRRKKFMLLFLSIK